MEGIDVFIHRQCNLQSLLIPSYLSNISVLCPSAIMPDFLKANRVSQLPWHKMKIDGVAAEFSAQVFGVNYRCNFASVMDRYFVVWGTCIPLLSLSLSLFLLLSVSWSLFLSRLFLSHPLRVVLQFSACLSHSHSHSHSLCLFHNLLM